MDDMEQAERLANTYADAILRLSYLSEKHPRCPGYLPDGLREAADGAPGV